MALPRRHTLVLRKGGLQVIEHLNNVLKALVPLLSVILSPLAVDLIVTSLWQDDCSLSNSMSSLHSIQKEKWGISLECVYLKK